MKLLVSLLIFLSVNSWAGIISDKAAEYTNRANAAKNHMGLIGASDDLPIWNGVYVAALSYKFSVTQDPNDLKEMEAILSSLLDLHDVTGIPGLFARRIDPIANPMPHGFVPASVGKWTGQMWKGHVSHDQYVGYLYGLLEAWPNIQDGALRERTKRVALQIGQHFLAQRERIVGPGTELNFDPSVLPKEDFPKFLSSVARAFWPRGGKAMYALQLLKVTSLISGDATLTHAYENMVNDRGYGLLVREHTQGGSEQLLANAIGLVNAFAKIFVGTAIKATSDSLRAEVAQNLGHISLYTLARAETHPRYRDHYIAAMSWQHQWVANHGNTFWNYLTISQTGIDDGGLAQGKDTLQRFPMDNYGVRGNGGDSNIPKYKGLTANFFKGDKWKWYSKDPMPIERRPMHSFAWQHNAMQMDGTFGNADCPGVAYLVAYWMGRTNGFISIKE